MAPPKNFRWMVLTLALLHLKLYPLMSGRRLRQVSVELDVIRVPWRYTRHRKPSLQNYKLVRARMTHGAIRGLDHIGLTVPNIEEAGEFLMSAFGAEFLFDTLNRDMPPFEGAAVERLANGPKGFRISRICMYKLGTGPTFELFEYDNVDGRRPALRGCDIGWQHIALYADDIDAALERAVAAGAEKLSDPWDLISAESGLGNKFCFIKTPWGALIELVTYPSPQQYEQETTLRRWKPPLIAPLPSQETQ